MALDDSMLESLTSRTFTRNFLYFCLDRRFLYHIRNQTNINFWLRVIVVVQVDVVQPVWHRHLMADNRPLLITTRQEMVHFLKKTVFYSHQ